MRRIHVVDHRRDGLDLCQQMRGRRAVGCRQVPRIRRGFPDVLEARECVGVVLLEVIGGRLVAQSLVDRERVALDDLVGEGVVLEYRPDCLRGGAGSAFRCSREGLAVAARLKLRTGSEG